MDFDLIIAIQTAVLDKRIPGSIDCPCTECGELVSLAPSSQKRIEELGPGNSKVICMPCVVRLGLLTEDGEPTLAVPSAMQAAEIEAEGIPVDEAVVKANRLFRMAYQISRRRKGVKG